MTHPLVAIGVCSNIFVRQMSFGAKGDEEEGHTHPFDHLTLLAKGSFEVEVNGQSTHFKAPAMVYIRAEWVHKIKALEDGSVAFCIHGLRDLNVSDDIISPDMIPNGSKLRELMTQVRNP